MKALLAQIPSTRRDIVANTHAAIEAIRRHPLVSLAVFPELFLGGYEVEDLESIARPANSPELREIAEAAREMRTAVIVGFTEKLRDGFANSVACIDEHGQMVGVYRKSRLFGPERQAFRPGTELIIVKLAGLRVAPLICFDIEFPEPARQLARAGAEMLVTASGNMEPFYVDHEVATRARAVENRLPHLYTNLVGASAGFTFVGGSRSVDPLGTVLAQASERPVELLADVGDRTGVDDRVDYLKLDFPEVKVAGDLERGRLSEHSAHVDDKARSEIPTSQTVR